MAGKLTREKKKTLPKAGGGASPSNKPEHTDSATLEWFNTKNLSVLEQPSKSPELPSDSESVARADVNTDGDIYHDIQLYRSLSRSLSLR